MFHLLNLVCLVCFLCGGEAAKVSDLSVYADLGSESSFCPGRWANAGEACGISASPVVVALGRADQSDIAPSVIRPITVLVVDDALGPLPGHVEPSEPMLSDRLAEESYSAVSINTQGTSPATDLSLAARIFDPSEYSSFRVVIHDLKQQFMRQFGHANISFAAGCGGGGQPVPTHHNEVLS